LAAIGAGVAERVSSRRHYASATWIRDHAVLEVQVIVLNHDVTGRRPPIDVPRVHLVAGEPALDSWRVEELRQRAVEDSAAADRNRTDLRSEIGHDGGEEPIAVLPVVTRHMERHVHGTAAGVAAEAHV